MTHGCELRRGIAGGNRVTSRRGAKWENWDNFNSRNNINIFLKAKEEH